MEFRTSFQQAAADPPPGQNRMPRAKPRARHAPVTPRPSVRLGFLLSLVVLSCSGCAIRPETAPFCWNSSHHIPPGGRFLRTSRPPEEVVQRLCEITEGIGGEIRSREEGDRFGVALAAEASERYRKARAYAAAQWGAIANNEYEAADDEAWREFCRNSSTQVQAAGSAGRAYRIVACLGKRVHSRKYQEFIATGKPGPMTIIHIGGYGGGYRGIGPIVTAGAAPGYTVTKVEYTHFASALDFHVFTDGGQTVVYAIGRPEKVTATKRIPSAPGRFVRNDQWPLVDGLLEADLIRRILARLDKVVNQDGSTRSMAGREQ